MLSKKIIFYFILHTVSILKSENDITDSFQKIKAFTNKEIEHSIELLRIMHCSKNNLIIETKNEFFYDPNNSPEEIFTAGYHAGIKTVCDTIKTDYVVLHNNDIQAINTAIDMLFDIIDEMLEDAVDRYNEIENQYDELADFKDDLIDQNNDILEDNHLLIKENRALIFQSNVNMGIGYLAGAISSGLFSYIVAISHIQNK